MPQTLNRLHFLTQGANSTSGLSPSQLAGVSWPMQDGKSLERGKRRQEFGQKVSQSAAVQRSRAHGQPGTLNTAWRSNHARKQTL